MILLGLVLVPGTIWFWVNPPIMSIWGNSPFIPRLIALFGFPASLYLLAWALYALIQPGAAVELNGAGLVVRVHPPKTRRAIWEEVTKVDKVNATTVAIHRRGGRPIKIFTDMIEPSWDTDAIIGLINQYQAQ